MAVKFIHTSDLHLDTPFTGLSNLNEQLAERLKDATFKSFENIINLALEESVDFVLISGDIFDSENKSLSAQLKFRDGLKRLSEQNISTYFICGNHDPLSTWLDSLDLPENVYRFGSKEVEKFRYEKSGFSVDIHGISFESSTTEENLAKKFEAPAKSAEISIALLHGTVGSHEAHAEYAPFSLDDINHKQFDYWALGHIHKPEIVQKQNPTVVYPGNPQGRDFGELGPRGCYLVELSKNSKPKLDFIQTQEVRFEQLEIDLTDIETIGKIPKQIKSSLKSLEDYNESASYIIRINFTGKTPLHTKLNKQGEKEQLTEYLNEGQLPQDEFVWIDTISLNTKPEVNLEQLKKRNDFSAEVLSEFSKLESDSQQLNDLLSEISNNFSPQAQRELSELTSKEKKEILNEAKWKLIDQLIS